jgi:hypothetical protein
MNNLEGIQHDREDLLEEHEDMDEDEDEEEQVIVTPPTEYIAQKLVEQGVTMMDFIKAMLKDHEEYDDEEEEYLRIDDDLFGKFRIIISNYQPEQQPEQQAQEQQPQQQQPPQQQTQEPKEETKLATVVVQQTRRPIIMHV